MKSVALLLRDELTLHPKWGSKRPEELRPEDFIDITAELYGEIPLTERFSPYKPLITRDDYETKRVWRHPSKNIHSDDATVTFQEQDHQKESRTNKTPKSIPIDSSLI